MRITIESGWGAGKTVELEGEEFTIGTDPHSDLVLQDPKASPSHARLHVLRDGRATLYDLGSAGGTFVDGERVESKVLGGGEKIRIGDTVLAPAVAEAMAEEAPTAAKRRPAGMQPTPAGTEVVPPPPPPTRESYGGNEAPPPPPTRRPSRTQSAIQRIMLQRAVNRATVIGSVAIVLVVLLGLLLAVGAFDSGGGGGTTALTNREIVAMVKPSTYMVVTNLGDSAARGTAWVWDAGQGIIVTNAHVVHGGTEWNLATGDHLKIEVQSGKVVLTPGGQDAKLIGEADCEDIGVLQVPNTSGLVSIQRGTQRDLQIGDHVLALGYPGTLNTTTSTAFMTPGFTSGDLTATSGDVSQVQTTFGAIPPESPGDGTFGPYQNVILTDTAINHGNSGGPLLNDKGQLVGMNSAGRSGADVQGQNYAVGIDRINEIVPKILAGQKVCG